jgi:D-ribulokinase
MADTTELTVALPSTAEPVLLGAAMLGAVAAGTFASLREAMKAMSRLGPLTRATSPTLTRFHETKRQVYSLMRKLDKESRARMDGLGVCSSAAVARESA